MTAKLADGTALLSLAAQSFEPGQGLFLLIR